MLFRSCMETQKTPNSQSNLEKEKWSWRHNPPRLQTILQSYSNQNSVVLEQKQTYGSVEQNRDPRNKPIIYSQLIFNKGGKTIQWRKEVSSASWESWIATCKLEHSLTPYTNSKWLKDLNIRHDTIKLLEENVGKTFSEINCSNTFLDQSPKAK